ncbi:hypothetical protein Dimus_008487 [Dionaea muscipula]
METDTAKQRLNWICLFGIAWFYAQTEKGRRKQREMETDYKQGARPGQAQVELITEPGSGPAFSLFELHLYLMISIIPKEKKKTRRLEDCFISHSLNSGPLDSQFVEFSTLNSISLFHKSDMSLTFITQYESVRGLVLDSYADLTCGRACGSVVLPSKLVEHRVDSVVLPSKLVEFDRSSGLVARCRF